VVTPRVLANDFPRQWADAGADAVAAIRRVGARGLYVLGEEVASFERALAGRTGRAFAVGCGSGLDAIEIALRALGLRPGDRVLTTPLSAFATTLAIVRAGGVPVFVDVDAGGLLDLDLVEAALAADPSCRSLVVVHLYGRALDLVRLAALRERFGLLLVEDCAQALGSRRGRREVGSAGQAAALSFYPTKSLGALGDGGALLTDDPRLAEAFRTLRDYGQESKYHHTVLGLNSRLDELHAAVLHRAFLPRLGRWTERRRQVAQAYLGGIRSSRVRPLPVAAGSEPAWHLFPVMAEAGSREAFLAHLGGRGVEAAVHYPTLICDQPALREVAFEVRGDLAHARAIAAREVSLPMQPYLDDDDVGRVLEAVASWT
jgi:dTDP-3-amino-3,4,6-trideoxy-alpha-D-glucose transaminase